MSLGTSVYSSEISVSHHCHIRREKGETIAVSPQKQGREHCSFKNRNVWQIWWSWPVLLGWLSRWDKAFLTSPTRESLILDKVVAARLGTWPPTWIQLPQGFWRVELLALLFLGNMFRRDQSPNQIGFCWEPWCFRVKKEQHNWWECVASERMFLKAHLFLQDFEAWK